MLLKASAGSVDADVACAAVEPLIAVRSSPDNAGEASSSAAVIEHDRIEASFGINLP
jgi:hypothetical protein